MKRRFWSMLVALLLVINILPLSNRGVFAQEKEKKQEQNDGSLKADKTVEHKEENRKNDKKSGGTKNTEDSNTLKSQELPKYIEVEVPAVWYPVDASTNEVIEGIMPQVVYPDMYERPEIAKLNNNDKKYYITLLSMPKPENPGSWSANNFIYTGNIFFTDRFHKIVASGYDTYAFSENAELISTVRRVKYGTYDETGAFNDSFGTFYGLHGMKSVEYQPEETMHLYLATKVENVKLSEAVFENEKVEINNKMTDDEIVSKLKQHIQSVEYYDFDTREVNYFDINNFDKLFIYRYTSEDDGEFISDRAEYKNFIGGPFEDLPPGRYEAVFPIYWNLDVPTYILSSDVFARYRIKIDDTVHFTFTKVNMVDIEVEKEWNDKNNQDGKRPDSVKINLLADGKATDQSLILDNSNDWKGKFESLQEYNDGQKIVYSIEEDTVQGYTTKITGSPEEGFKITNTCISETIDIEGAKTWDDENNKYGNRPEKIVVKLFADNKEVQKKEVKESDGWKWKFEKLPKYENGKLINYTIDEENVEHYLTQIRGYDIINRHNVERIFIDVSKVWDDANNQDGKRPESVTIVLKTNISGFIRKLVLNESNNWKGTFENLSKYVNGVKVIYNIYEEPIDGYTTEISGKVREGFVVKNTHIPEIIDIEVSKTWEDADNQDAKRPKKIVVKLFANGKELQKKEVTEKDGWKWKFEKLPKYKDGKLIDYTIKEEAVESYTAEIDGYNIINRHNPEKRTIHVLKIWKDDFNKDGKRPEKITVKLYADGKETGKELILNESNKWKDSFGDLDVYKDGKEIVYTISEIQVENYSTQVSGNFEEGFIIVNTYQKTDDKDKTPDTGDNSKIYLQVGVVAVAVVALGVIFFVTNRKKNK